MAGNIFMKNGIEKDNKNFRIKQLGLRLLRTLGIHGGCKCIDQLSLSLGVVFFLLFAATFRRDAVPCVLKMLQLAQIYPGHS